MQDRLEILTPRTTTDVVFETLQEEILSLKLLPGTKISEAEIARRLGVSRQPVRDAFNRLGNMDLLLIRPQRATEVRGFSMQQIDYARFLRMALELEVIEQACGAWDADRSAALRANLAAQEAAMNAGEVEQFHALDYAFHRMICELSGQPLAFETIQQSKRKIDRLCVLSLDSHTEVAAIYADHTDIVDALDTGSVESARRVMRRHLSRLDATIVKIHAEHSEYFE